MSFLKVILKDILTEKNIKDEDIFKMNSDEEIYSYLTTILNISKQEIDNFFQKYFKIKHFNIENQDKLITYQKNIIEEYDKYKFLAFENGKSIIIASLGIPNAETKKFTKRFFPNNIDFDYQVIFEHEFDEILKKHKKNKKTSETIIKNLQDANVVKWVNEIITKGIEEGSSDIHFEPREKYYQVRYRIDGLLTDGEKYDFSPRQVAEITSRLKIMAEVDNTESRKPQDGRINGFRIEKSDKIYDLRLSTVKIGFGEKVVLRIFEKSSRIYNFEQLGYDKEEEEIVKKLIHSPYGIIYLSGPTGSGKTTTLYTMLDEINSDDINIYSIEDPVEKTIEGINQIEIDPLGGVDYNNTLKALLRQDPDVIVIGEVRDTETAETSIKTALTGHLVLATVHANNSIETINRLFNMNVEPYLLGTASLGYISQRLVRTLCPQCKIKRELNTTEKIWLEKYKEKYNIKDLDISNIYFQNEEGCSCCKRRGYKGRMPIAEILIINEDIRKIIASDFSVDKVKKYLNENGFKNFEQKCFNKVLNGLTSIDEYIRVIQ